MAPSNSANDTRVRLSVHETHRPPAPVLRYIDQVVGLEESNVTFRYSQGVLTKFDVDVAHVVDSKLDQLLGTNDATAWQRLLSVVVFVRNLRRHRIALVRTLDSADKRLAEHRSERLANRILDRATDAFVVLDESTPSPVPVRTTLIPRSHHIDRFIGYPSGEQVRGRILCVGADHLPATVRGVIAATRVVSTPDVTIRLAGLPPRGGDAPIRSAIARRPGVVSARIERLSDAARVQEIDSAELVVLPREIVSFEDLQLLFVVLSRERSVVTPRTKPLEHLAAELGPGWLHLTDGAVTATALDRAFAELHEGKRSPKPMLSGRDASTISAKYESVFRTAVERRRGTSAN